MKTDTQTLARAMDILSRAIQSQDGIANAAIREAAERLRELDGKIDADLTRLAHERDEAREHLRAANPQHDLLQHFDLEALVHSSFRYFLGRRTIGTCAYARSLAAAWPHLSKRTRFGIGRELAHAYAEAARYPERQPLGADCDREAWDAVRDAMEETK
jgi:hypothetical protein